MGRAHSLSLWASIGIALALPAVAQPLSTPLAPEKPVAGETPKLGAPPPGIPEVAEIHVRSVDLGFDKGVGPAPGQSVTWQGAAYIVVDAVASEGRPTFSGGSRFVITSAGGSLEIGLKAVAPVDAQVAQATR
ncbi:MAG TPA: hypothetical protein VFE73_01355 [Reyranella sp.]|jgi:hypothetical protein|nr:hypothetical protein [Reyranella sp.]